VFLQGRVSSAQSSAWAEEYQAGPSQPSMARLSSRDSSYHAPTPWTAEFLGTRGSAGQPPDSSRAAPGSQWAQQFLEARPKSEQWAEEFASSSAQVSPMHQIHSPSPHTFGVHNVRYFLFQTSFHPIEEKAGC